MFERFASIPPLRRKEGLKTSFCDLCTLVDGTHRVGGHAADSGCPTQYVPHICVVSLQLLVIVQACGLASSCSLEPTVAIGTKPSRLATASLAPDHQRRLAAMVAGLGIEVGWPPHRPGRNLTEADGCNCARSQS